MLAILIESAVRSLAVGVVIWAALRLLRVRAPQTRSLAWTAVLLTALTMPLLMPLMAAIVSSAPEAAMEWIPAAPPSLLLKPLAPGASTSPATGTGWQAALWTAYIAITVVFALRLAVGLIRSHRLRQTATPLAEPWTLGSDVRVSRSLAIPATIGSTILFPTDWPQWSDFKRNAVLLHEQAHVRRGDFYVYLLAGVHRAIFWFNPLSWWVQKELVEFAEAACDDAAIQEVADRAAYAEALVDLATRGSEVRFVGLAMARGRTVANRVERILQETRVAPRPSVFRRVLLFVAFLPLAAIAAGSWLVEAKTITFVPALPLAQQPPAVPAQQRPQQGPQQAPQQPQPARPQEASQFLAAWPEMEVPDIVTDQEREAFRKLSSDTEREQFVEQFWLRRDPTPGTPGNEFREEYYRRIATANERFTSQGGGPGWKTDRGRIYIRYGRPDEVETHSLGRTYIRDIAQGGGRTITFPFERWRYKFIEGLGQNIILEFVDTEITGNYRLTYDPTKENGAPRNDQPRP
jgi:GWxTD domain-containing protein